MSNYAPGQDLLRINKKIDCSEIKIEKFSLTGTMFSPFLTTLKKNSCGSAMTGI